MDFSVAIDLKFVYSYDFFVVADQHQIYKFIFI